MANLKLASTKCEDYLLLKVGDYEMKVSIAFKAKRSAKHFMLIRLPQSEIRVYLIASLATTSSESSSIIFIYDFFVHHNGALIKYLCPASALNLKYIWWL